MGGFGVKDPAVPSRAGCRLETCMRFIRDPLFFCLPGVVSCFSKFCPRIGAARLAQGKGGTTVALGQHAIQSVRPEGVRAKINNGQGLDAPSRPDPFGALNSSHPIAWGRAPRLRRASCVACPGLFAIDPPGLFYPTATPTAAARRFARCEGCERLARRRVKRSAVREQTIV
jgi:hypothetical protein